ncbi:MAG: TRAP transporter substrate-binding protein [Betaproteobacteria bacterium]|nr:TRAP transporter substrate-binding protein [Betaproteobacteria bacterium]
MNFMKTLIAGGLLLAAPVYAQQVTLKVAHFLPAGAPTQQRVLQPWCDELKQESQGRIVCQFYPAMQLGGTPAQLVDQVKNGVADIVWTAPGYSTGRFPRIEAFELPFVVADAVSGSRAVWKFYQQYAQQEFAAYKVLAFHVDGGQAVHTGSKQVKTLGDWKGLKLRTSTRLGTQTAAALGATPVGMPPSQLTESISKGIVDGAMGAWELVVPLKLDEVTKFHSQPAAGQPYPSATVLMVLMNKRKFDALPADLKAMIEKRSGLAMTEKLGQVFDDQNSLSHKKVLERGNTVTDFSAAEMAAMRKATAPVEAEWIQQVTAKGADGKALAAAAHNLANQELAAEKR